MIADTDDIALEEDLHELWVEDHIAPFRRVEEKFVTLKDIDIKEEDDVHKAIKILKELRVVFLRHNCPFDGGPHAVLTEIIQVAGMSLRTTLCHRAVQNRQFSYSFGYLISCIQHDKQCGKRQHDQA